MTKLLVIGAGGYGRAVAEAAEATGRFHVVGFVDDWLPAGEIVAGKPVLGPSTSLDGLRGAADCAVVALGDNSLRETLARHVTKHGYSLTSIIHPRAFVAPSATIGFGCTIMAGSVIGSGCKLGEGVIVNYGAVIDHDCQLGAFCRVSAGACMGGGAILRASGFLAPGQVVERE